MPESVPPHFHKDYRIEERDLIPDGAYISVVPDFEAPEGTEVSYLNGGTFRRYKMLDGTWRIIGETTVSVGWQFVSYQSSSVNPRDITVSGLDLDADLQYMIIVQCRQVVTSTGVLRAQVNSDSTAGAHTWLVDKSYYFSAGSPTTGTDGSLSATSWTLGESLATHYCVMYLGYVGGDPVATWQCSGIGTTGGLTDAIAVASGTGYWNSNNDISSIKFYFNAASGTCDWKVWVFKAATS